MAKSLRLAQFLTEVLGRPVEPKFYSSYEAILQDLADGKLDFAELGPYNFYKLRAQAPHIKSLVFLRQYPNQESYRCVLASAIDGLPNLSSIAQTPNANVLLTQPLSTCGWFSSEYLFRQAGFDLNQYPHAYQGSHEGVALALLRKEAWIGSLADFMAQRYERLGLNVLATTPPLPPFSIVANPKAVGDELWPVLIQKMIQLDEVQTKDWGLGQYGFLPFDSRLQSEFEQMIEEMQPDLGAVHE